MNYGYEPTEFDEELFNQLQGFVSTLPPDEEGMRCYVERDQQYQGVRIRRITHYVEAEKRRIVEEADKIYASIEARYRPTKKMFGAVSFDPTAEI